METLDLHFVRWLLLPPAILLACAATAQPGGAVCRDASFDREVRRMLQMSVPVLDVDSIHIQPGRYTILDAREWEEYAVSHIPGARHIGYRQYSERNLRGLSKDTPIAVYCSIGYRSEKIAERLKKQGYTQVYNVYGSIFEWANRGYPLVTQGGGQSLRVHTYNRKWSRWVLNGNVEKVW